MSFNHLMKSSVIVLIAALLITALIIPLSSDNRSPSSLKIGPLVVEASSEPKCVELVLADRSLELNGARYSGVVELELGGETRSVMLDKIVKDGGVARVCFEKGVEREIESVRRVYQSIGLNVAFDKGVEGLDGRAIAERFRLHGISAIGVPTVSINLWLLDGNGTIYTSTASVSSLHHYMLVKGLSYTAAFEESLRDPFAHLRSGLKVLIPSLKDLFPYLVRIDPPEFVKKAPGEVSIQGVAGSHVNTGCTFLLGDGCLFNYLNYPAQPPGFWRDRVRIVAKPSGVTDDQVYGQTWKAFIDLYGSIHLFDKSRYPTLESVRNRLNTVYASAAREGLQSMDEVVSKFANNVAFTGSVVLEWSPSMVPGSIFEFKKPFVISLGAFTASDPSFTVSFIYSHFTAGYMGSGVAYMGYVRYLREYYWVSTDMAQIRLSLVPNYVNEGVRYAALVIPVFMEYVEDKLMLTWHFSELTDSSTGVSYWVARPVAVVIPYYKILLISSRSQWGICYYNADGGLVAGNNCATSLNSILYNATSYLVPDTRIVYFQNYGEIPTYPYTVDYYNASRTNIVNIVADGAGLFAEAVNSLLGIVVDAACIASSPPDLLSACQLVADNAARKMVEVLSQSTSFAFSSTGFNTVSFMLTITRDSVSTTGPGIAIEKYSLFMTGGQGFTPLYVRYHVYPVRGGAGGCLPGNPDCDLPLGFNE